MIFYADSVGHLAPIENYAPDQIVTFGGLEYTMDSHGELVLSGWTPGRIEGLSDFGGLTLKLISLEDIGLGSPARWAARRNQSPPPRTTHLSIKPQC
jgi:hypothetical protein